MTSHEILSKLYAIAQASDPETKAILTKICLELEEIQRLNKRRN